MKHCLAVVLSLAGQEETAVSKQNMFALFIILISAYSVYVHVSQRPISRKKMSYTTFSFFFFFTVGCFLLSGLYSVFLFYSHWCLTRLCTQQRKL